MLRILPNGSLWIIFSFFLGIVLSLLPLPVWADWFRPEWLLLVVLYWALALPHRISIGAGWVLGLLLDAMNGTLLGEHALAMAVSVYLIVVLHRRVRLFPVWQQAVVIFGLTLLYQLIIFAVQGVIGEDPHTWLYWAPSFTSMLMWPWIFTILRDWRRRYQVT